MSAGRWGTLRTAVSMGRGRGTNYFKQDPSERGFHGSGYEGSNAERFGNAYVEPGHQDEPVNGVCRSQGQKNVLDMPRFNLQYTDESRVVFESGLPARGYYVRGPGGYGTGFNTGNVGGKLAGTVDGRTYCCPRDASFTIVRSGENISLNAPVKKIHCCGGPLPKDRDEALSKFENGCYAGKKSFSGQQLPPNRPSEHNLGHARYVDVKGEDARLAQKYGELRDPMAVAASYTPPDQLDADANAANEGAFADGQSVAPYTAGLDTADGADSAAADADAADALPAEDVLAEALAPVLTLELAAEHRPLL